jgi:hypothetical protein
MLSIDCESIRAGNVPARKSGILGVKRNAAAQLVLGLPSGLRRFCAASFEKIVNFCSPVSPEAFLSRMVD